MKKLLPAAFAACLFLLILTAKWATFDRYGSPMPDWDQWDAEAVETFIPWFTNDHFLTHLFHPHNEHRVVLTKLQNLALVLLNGQWDSRLEAVSNALLHTALALGFWLLALRCFVAQSSEQRVTISEHHASSSSTTTTRYPLLATRYFLLPPLFLLTFALFGLPVAWQNVLGGFHSQQYWLAGLSFVAIVTLPFVRSFSAAWWIGAVSGILALGSMGSGFLAAVAVVIVLAFRLLRRETTLRATWPALALCAALIAIGVLTRHEVPWHQEMKAKTAHDFIFSIVHSLQWPWRERDWAAPILWFPWFVLAWRVLRSPRSTPSPDSRLAQTILALGGWVLLQLAATAYARGAGADFPASRYMDTLTFGTMANALALVWLLRSQRTSDQGPETRDLDPEIGATPAGARGSRSLVPGPRSLVLGPWSLVLLLSLVWLATCAFGLRHLLGDIVRWEIADAKTYYTKAEGHMRRYLATNNPAHLAHKDIPFPSAEGLAERLAQPTLRVLMPVPIRTPVTLAPAASPSNTSPANDFVENNAIDTPDIVHPPRAGLSPTTPPLDYTKTWGSHTAAGPAFTGQWRSAPVQTTLGAWLKFEVAGDLHASTHGASLRLLDADTHAVLADVRPRRFPGNTWRSVYVRAPARPFIVAADDASPHAWFAFSPPVEMGWLSYLAWQATKHALLLFWIVAGLTLLLAGLALVFRRSVSTDTAPARLNTTSAATL